MLSDFRTEPHATLSRFRCVDAVLPYCDCVGAGEVIDGEDDTHCECSLPTLLM
jgi:hypothetical protein